MFALCIILVSFSENKRHILYSRALHVYCGTKEWMYRGRRSVVCSVWPTPGFSHGLPNCCWGASIEFLTGSYISVHEGLRDDRSVLWNEIRIRD